MANKRLIKKSPNFIDIIFYYCYGNKILYMLKYFRSITKNGDFWLIKNLQPNYAYNYMYNHISAVTIIIVSCLQIH